MRAQVALWVVVAAGPSAAGPVSVPFESSRPGEVAVPVTVGSRGPFRFLVDTGSTHSAVTTSLARTLGARPIARAPVTATAGTLECLVVELRGVAVGGAAVPALAATQLPDEASRVLGSGIDGILGQDFLASFGFTIDYRQRQIRWFDAAGEPPQGTGRGPASAIRLRLVPSQDRFVVELPQDGGDRPLRLVPDSGADTVVLYDPRLVPALSGAPMQDRATLASPTGTRDVRTATIDRLRVGSRTLGRQRAVILPARPATPGVDAGNAPPDGLLPLHLFAQVSFSARERWLVLQPH